MFIHSVYFWLKDGVSNTARLEMMADANEKLREIPTVQQFWAGPPAGTPRDIVDNSYQIGLTVILEDAEAHEIYQEHPLHQEFIAKHKMNWEKVLVYDFLAGS